MQIAGPAFPLTIFVLGTAEDSGKTVASIGVIAKLLAETHWLSACDIGYMKPVGQHTVPVLDSTGRPYRADKDSVLVTSLMRLNCPGYEYVSPVLWLRGRTADCIDQSCAEDPLAVRTELLDKVRAAYCRVAVAKSVVVVEGTGQLGVGSVAGVSNADVIATLQGMGVPVRVILVAREGYGGAIDLLFPHLISLHHLGIRVDGLIINRIAPERIHHLRANMQSYYREVFPSLYGEIFDPGLLPRIYGCVPEIPELAQPTMRFIAEHFAKQPRSDLLILNPRDFQAKACGLIKRIRALSLAMDFSQLVRPGDAVIVGANANERMLSLINTHDQMLAERGEGLAGIILSCARSGGTSGEVSGRLQGTDLPVIMMSHDTGEIVREMGQLTIKIQPYDLLKCGIIARSYADYLTDLPLPPPRPSYQVRLAC